MSVQTNEELVRRFFEHLARGEVAAALAYMADHATWSVVGRPAKFPLAGIKSKGEIGALLSQIYATIIPGGMQIKLYEMMTEGDHIAVAAEIEAETVRGRVYHEYHYFFFVVCDGQIQMVREYAVVQAQRGERLGAQEGQDRAFPCALQPGNSATESQRSGLAMAK